MRWQQVLLFTTVLAGYPLLGCGKNVKQRGLGDKPKQAEASAHAILSNEGEGTADPLAAARKQCEDAGGRWDGSACLTDGAETLVEALPLCSDRYDIPGSANIFLAGMPAGTTLTYDVERNGTKAKSTDAAPAQSPVEVVPTYDHCLRPGDALYFDVSGTINHATNQVATNADGRLETADQHHALGAQHGKSDIRAPLNSLIGVFLANAAPPATSVPMLDFSSGEQRNYASLSPLIGQVFYIGDGKRADGSLQSVIIPAGTKRLFIGIMDGYEWNNNTGQLELAIRAKAP